ncbi:hypothetical protein BBP40_010896 [Aspergillus hancockii]|nr:hypothetical protein BBP40_010896 [Aspergillus hancockii]
MTPHTVVVVTIPSVRRTIPLPPNDDNASVLGSIGHYNIVIVPLPKGKVGPISAVVVATQMMTTYPAVRFILLVDIGGAPPSRVKLGDIVVSTATSDHPHSAVVQWDYGKVEEGDLFKQTG